MNWGLTTGMLNKSWKFMLFSHLEHFGSNPKINTIIQVSGAYYHIFILIPTHQGDPKHENVKQVNQHT